MLIGSTLEVNVIGVKLSSDVRGQRDSSKVSVEAYIGALQAQVVEVEKETSKVEWLKTSNVQV